MKLVRTAGVARASTLARGGEPTLVAFRGPRGSPFQGSRCRRNRTQGVALVLTHIFPNPSFQRRELGCSLAEAHLKNPRGAFKNGVNGDVWNDEGVALGSGWGAPLGLRFSCWSERVGRA